MAKLLEFGADVVVLTADVVPLLLALALATLIKGKTHAVLVVINLWLFMELAVTLLDPGYRFGSLVTARLLATVIQVGLACGAIAAWRSWRFYSARVTVH